MKRLLTLLFALVSFAAYSQMNTFGGVGFRVNDTTTYQTNAAAYHTAGYRDIYFNNQATTKHWDIWNGSSYQHVFTFGGGSGGGAAWGGITGTLSSQTDLQTALDSKSNNIPTNAGALSGTELTFNVTGAGKKYTKTISSDQSLTLAASGNVADSYIFLTTTGDGSHLLTFPGNWVMKGDAFDPEKIQEMVFRYTGNNVIGVITTLSALPDAIPPVLTTSAVESLTTSTLDLVFDESVSITTAGWTLSASGGAVTVSSVASGNTTATPHLGLSRAITVGETITISYNPAVGNTTDQFANELATISGASVSNNIVVQTIIVQDDFNDSSIDVTKWALTNPADGVSITETTTLNMISNPASPVASANTNYAATVASFTDNINVFRFTLAKNSTAVSQGALVKIYNASDTYATSRHVQVTRTNGATSYIMFRVYDGTQFVYDFTSPTVTWSTSAGAFRVVKSTNTYSLQVWSGSTWNAIASYNIDLGGPIKVSFNANSVASDSSSPSSPSSTMDTFYVTNYVYNTVIP